MMFLLFKPGFHASFDLRSWCLIKSRYLEVLTATLLELTLLYALCMNSLVLHFYSFLPLILMQVQIIRDNLISSLNHCDPVCSVSLARSTPLFPSITFTISVFFIFPSLWVSRSVSEQCISITKCHSTVQVLSLALVLCLSLCLP